MARGLIALLLCSLSSIAFAEQRPLISLVIDDLGYSLEQGKAAIALPGQHTYAILPGASYSLKLARYAQEKNKEVILHLPMQSIRSTVKPEPNALNEAMDENQLSARVESLLAKIPHIKGVNNHMGSHLTGIDFFMRPIMDIIRDYDADLYFLDSRTTPNSVAYAEALEAGLASTSRDIFLDNDHEDIDSIRAQVERWLDQARRLGSAVAIGHPHENTILVLNEYLPQIRAEFEFLPISKMILQRNDSNHIATWKTIQLAQD